MKTTISLLFILLLSLAVCGQNLPSNFEYQRETGQTTGVPIFNLTPSADAMAGDALLGKTFEEAVGGFDFRRN